MFILSLLSTAFAGPNPGVIAVAHAEFFQIEQAARYEWSASKTTYDKGTLFVVRVEGDYAKSSQTNGDVLYVGNTPAARLNPGHLDSHVIAFVPSEIDFTATPIFWGPPTLPERVRPTVEGRKALETAQAKPFTADQLSGIQSTVHMLRDEKHIHVRAAELIDTFAPQDKDFASGYRAGWKP